MASIQDLETRVVVIEDKLEFLMRAIPLKVAHALAPQATQLLPALEVYRMIKGMGADLQEAVRMEASPILGANGETRMVSAEKVE